MSTQNRLRGERNQKQVMELATLPGNNICADCKARAPRWTSHNLGIFICVHCASIHRKIGTHITKVKSLTMDDWTSEQVETMRSMGNVKSNSIYNPNELRHPPPPNLEDSERDSEIEVYIRSKYEYRKFLDKSALVASKLGPSRSASSITSSSSLGAITATSDAASSPLAARKPPPSSSSASQLGRGRPDPEICPFDSKTSAPPTRSAAQPVPAPTRQQTKPSPLGGVWDDLNSLTNHGQDSSLPLQFQTPSMAQTSQPQQAAFLNGAMGANGYPVGVTSAGAGMNPYQPQQLGVNPFSQQSAQSPFAPPPFNASPMVSSSFGQPQPQSQQSYGQQYFGGSSSTQPSAMMNQQHTASFFQPTPQHQSSLQASSTQNFLSPSPSQPFMSAPVTQTQFFSSSPQPQFGSHSPQPQMHMRQQPQSAMPTQTSFMGSGMYQSPASAQTQMQNGFMGMTTMQMQQQMLLQQQQFQQAQQQQQYGQGMYNSSQQQQPQMMASQPTMNGMYSTGGTQTFAQGGYPAHVGGGQWGGM